MISPGLIDFLPLLVEVERLGFGGIVGVEAFSRSNLAPDHADALAIWRDTFEDGDELALQALDLIRRAFNAR
jgi:D-psicose/D-tagatose/L-ribulose 3-epimerase